MMEIMQGKKNAWISQQDLQALIQKFTKIHIDLGTGDGKFIYESAKAYPDNFWIGIDADRQSLEEYSHKIYRKPSKGGIPNALYVVANAQQLPSELEHIADQVWIILPWGSLLQGAVAGHAEFCQNLCKIAKSSCSIVILIDYEVKYEAAEIQKMGLPSFTPEYCKLLEKQYAQHGLQILSWQWLDNAALQKIPSKWARRLAFGRARQTLQWTCGVYRADCT